MNRIEDILIDLDFRIRSWISNFAEEERGAVDIIAMLVMIVVVIAVASIFQGRLITVVGKAFDMLEGFFKSE